MCAEDQLRISQLSNKVVLLPGSANIARLAMRVSIGVCHNQLMRRSCRIYLEVSPDVRREAEHDEMMHADRNL